jgi:hypothetical protein
MSLLPSSGKSAMRAGPCFNVAAVSMQPFFQADEVLK